MIELSVLNGLLVDCAPFRAELALVQVDDCFANEVVAKERVIVPGLNLERCSPRKSSSELENLIELGIGLVKLVLISEADRI